MIDAARRWAGEWMLALVAGSAFLGSLGSVELWGRREQRAAAEAVDTVDHGHWLVAEIAGRPRLEKPPLPRWAVAGLMTITGRRDEAILRWPNALAGLATVGLVYLLGCRIGGRSVGLASGFAMASSAYFLAEMRQAGHDAFLAPALALAMLAAWRRLDGGGRGWNLVLGLALGLGFLSKGPVVILLATVPIVGHLAATRRLKAGLRLLLDGRSLLLFAALALAWPVPVLMRDPASARVWWLEMGQKLGASGVVHGNARGSILLDWAWMTLPWTPLALLSAIRPLRRPKSPDGLGLARWWALGNLAMLGCWQVAKPNYYLPCLPAVALMAGSEWIRLANLARSESPARWPIQLTWVAAFVAAVLGPVAMAQVAPTALPWAVGGGLLLAGSSVMGAWAWHRGRDASALAWPASGLVAVALIAYAAIAPAANPARGHRALAAELDRIIPDATPTVWTFDELDEGLGFYLRRHALTPILDGQGRHNRGLALREAIAADGPALTPERRVAQAREALADWAIHEKSSFNYVIIRSRLYDRPGFADRLGPIVEPAYREQGVERNALVLLRAKPAAAMALLPGPGARR